MKNQEIVDYLATQVAAGHSEKSVREHLVAHGWSEPAADEAFAQYHAAQKPEKSARDKRKELRRGGRQVVRKWTPKRFIKLSIMLVVILGGIGFAVGRHYHQEPIAKPVALTALTYTQRQLLDVNIVAGAIGQYVAANNGTLPTQLSVNGGSLVMCNQVCDPSTSAVAQLGVFKPQNIKLVPYQAGLKVPDTSLMYLVPQAKCASQTSIDGQNPHARSMVLLYDEASGSSATKPTSSQRCIIL
ncbi:MAG: hypothetical protein WDN27_04030 [Candidatus Saccharibacteria bacterium]